jgi:tetratricopeptide (TPR) repeat protein
LRAERFAAALLVPAAFVAYHNALRGPFILDDLYSIARNPTIRSLWPLSSVLSPPAHSAVTGRPIVNLTLALNYAFGGLNVGSYHLFNLTVHVLAALVLFAIIRRTLDAPPLRVRYRGQSVGLALAVALLWVVHPLTSESVNYTIQRTELLMGLFFLLTLYCALRGFESPERWSWHAGALAAFALGLGSKEVIAVAPVIVLVYDWFFRSKSLREVVERHWRLYAGFVVVLASYVLLVGTRLRRAFTPTNRTVTPWDYAKTECGVIVHYLRLVFWPDELAGDYAGWPIARSVAEVLPSLIVIAALVALTSWGFARRHKLALVGVWCFAILAPTSSFRPLAAEIAAERRMYLPLAGIIVLVVLAGHTLLRRVTAPRGAGVAIVLVLAATLSFVTVRRNNDYRTTLAFWSDVVAKRPDNPRARIWLGNYPQTQGRSAEALEHLTAAVRLGPGDGHAQYSLGVVLASQGKRDQAIDRYREALRIDHENAPAHNNLGILLADRGEIDEAIEHYREAIRIDPAYAGARYNIALVLGRRGRMAEAINNLEAAIRLKPDFPEARRALEDFRRRADR